MSDHSFKRDYAWQMKYLPQVKQVILDQLPRIARISEASFEEDATRNTDLVLKIDATRIAVRLRRAKDMYRRDKTGHRYVDQFTLRSYRSSGVDTELTKVLAGWGNFNFYGFADETDLVAWLIGDLSAFRLWHQREVWRLGHRKGPDEQMRMPGGDEVPNHDRTTRFRPYLIDEVNEDGKFVVARHLPPPLAGAA